MTTRYDDLYRALARSLPAERLVRDPLRTLAYGTDASFYRLVPRLVVRAETEDEVRLVLAAARARGLPLTFRAAGTSLSGQAVSDSILVSLGEGFRGLQVEEGGARIRLEAGVIGALANRALAPYGRKIGPDPASINSAMIGGIAANNASGMCCGTAQSSYRTVRSMRLVLADGAVLDTGDPASRRAFAASHAGLLARLAAMGERVRADAALADRIRRKYRMKNTTGYSLNALVDYHDPFDIAVHLMIGSEGTLGFISSITLDTVEELPDRSSALMLFPDIGAACAAIPLLRALPVAAAELMDRASLRSVEDKPGMPPELRELDGEAAALLVETRGHGAAELEGNVAAIAAAMAGLSLLRPLAFTAVPAEMERLWNIRKGLFPSIGAVRATGTTVVIEDVTFPIPRLAEAVRDLRRLFEEHGYHEAIVFGHAFEGNVHFVFCQGFNEEAEVRRYQAFMDDLTRLVVTRYDGALKAEHGTGRNMAPFVELEWGSQAYGVMKEIKALFDPEGLLNPGVVLNPDPRAHLRHLKALPAADPIIDKCIECGFCEVKCPSRALTLTPRQRIVAVRELARLDRSGDDPARRRALAASFQHDGVETCATDGLCATSCPVGIDTGKLVKELRFAGHSPEAQRAASWVADHFAGVTAVVRAALGLVSLLAALLGARFMRLASGLLRRLVGRSLPAWTPELPGAAEAVEPRPVDAANPRKVVYLPSCISRTMGVPRGSGLEASLTRTTERLLRRAGFEVIYPRRLASLCCGMAFSSKGFKEQGARKLAELEAALLEASAGGAIPVLLDTSPCAFTLLHKPDLDPRLQIHEPVGFSLAYLTDTLDFRKLPETAAVHATCSAVKRGLDAPRKKLAGLCAEKVVVPPSVGCCGWAGDRGFSYPELNASALVQLRRELPPTCKAGYSTSRTCEIGLSQEGHIPYQSILYLVDRATRAKQADRG